MRVNERACQDDYFAMRERSRAVALSKAQLRAQADQAMATATKPIVKLPTKVVRQCGRCGESSAVMVEPGQPVPDFKCKRCDPNVQRS
jgi:hypothetical protein